MSFFLQNLWDTDNVIIQLICFFLYLFIVLLHLKSFLELNCYTLFFRKIVNWLSQRSWSLVIFKYTNTSHVLASLYCLTLSTFCVDKFVICITLRTPYFHDRVCRKLRRTSFIMIQEKRWNNATHCLNVVNFFHQ